VITAIFTFLVFVTYHFVYESILAPSLRLSLRFQLLVLRDEVRKLKIECGPSLDDKHFLFLQDWVNFLISALNRLDLVSLARAEVESKREPEILKRAQERSKMLDDCNIPRARAIRKQAASIASRALLVNNGAWIIFIAPILICTVGYGNLNLKIKLLTTMSGKDFQKIATEDPVAVQPV
jgi:hypothetical protein